VPERLDEALSRLRNMKGPPLLVDLARLTRHLKQDPFKHRMAVKSGSKYVVFEPSQVSALVAKDHYAVILVGDRELLADDSLDDLSARLDPDKFLRIHRSAVVNLDYLRELENEGDRKYKAVLSDARKTRLPVSRERLEELKIRLGLGE
jgi:two-component system LytT family response regulator